jgi:hypothetical protein
MEQLKKPPLFPTLLLIIYCILFASCGEPDEFRDLDCTAIGSKYNADISPIIISRCATAGCHDAGSNNGDYTTYDGIKIKVKNGTFENRVLIVNDMPSNGVLSEADRKKIKCWLDNGAIND